MTSQPPTPASLTLTEPLSLAAEIPEGPLSSLSAEQRARVAALSLAAPLITGRSLTGKSAPDVYDLMRVAQWILDGTDLIDSLGKEEP